MRKKATGKAFLTSLMAVVMSVVMLAGTTFAWFTDTASTSVNQIKAGTLQVALEMQNAEGKWVNAQGEKLQWLRAVDETGKTELADSTNILWEPGCTYRLQPVRVRNDGNLALKYKIEISGIDGDAELNDVIDWTITLDGKVFAAGSEHHLAAAAGDNAPAHELMISGTMRQDAGNHYQGMTIDGVAITVLATQDTVEFDSNSNGYDAEAVYPVYDAASMKKALEEADDGAVLQLSGVVDMADEALTVEKDITISGGTLANAPVRAAEGARLTLTDVAFTGGSYIVSAKAEAVIMNGCTVDVSGVKKITGRAAFLVVGTGESTTPVKLDIRNSTFKVSSAEDAYAAAIFGWGRHRPTPDRL